MIKFMDGTLQSLHEFLPPTSDSTLAPTAPRILLAEDSAVLRQLYEGILRHQGYQVDAVADGAAAWECLQQGGYDLLITDNSMPRMTGIELVGAFRQTDQTTPVILVSGTIPIEDLRLHPELKFSAVLTKPFRSALLLQAVAEVLQRAVNLSRMR